MSDDRFVQPEDPVEAHRCDALMEAVGAEDVQTFLQTIVDRHKAQAPAVVTMMAADVLLHMTPMEKWDGPPVRVANVPIGVLTQYIVDQGPRAVRCAIMMLAVQMSLIQSDAILLKAAAAVAKGSKGK